MGILVDWNELIALCRVSSNQEICCHVFVIPLFSSPIEFQSIQFFIPVFRLKRKSFKACNDKFVFCE